MAGQLSQRPVAAMLKPKYASQMACSATKFA
jgi:hypothetical protein